MDRRRLSLGLAAPSQSPAAFPQPFAVLPPRRAGADLSQLAFEREEHPQCQAASARSRFILHGARQAHFIKFFVRQRFSTISGQITSSQKRTNMHRESQRVGKPTKTQLLRFVILGACLPEKSSWIPIAVPWR